MKAITTRSGVAYEGPSIPTNPSPKKVVERETEETTDKEQTNFQGSTAQIPPLVIPISILEPDVPKTLPKTTPIPESDIPKNLPKPNIPYPSRRDDQKSHDKASNQMEKIFQIFQDLRFDISFADALLLMPRFAPMIKSLLMNKEKLLELAKIPLNENCSAMLLKKLPEKLGDPGKFLIPCNFPGMDVCHALADLGASINLMPLSIWKKLSLPELTPTRMTLELADRSITYPKGLAEDVFVKVKKFHFPTDFVVVDLKPILEYSSTNDKSVNRIDIIDAVCEEYASELLGFPNSSGGNPTPTSEPFTSEFILEESEAYLKDDSISPEIDHADYDPKEDIYLIEKLLNNDPFQLPPMDLKQRVIVRMIYLHVMISLPSTFQWIQFLLTFSNPLFKLDVNFKNPLLDEVLEDIECKDYYDSNLDESSFLVTPLSDSNKDECLTPGDDIEFLLHDDPSTPLKNVAFILRVQGFIYGSPFEDDD
ncbi:reverse transcriptase domain-containing protein [Tanacetum coccineum]